MQEPNTSAASTTDTVRLTNRLHVTRQLSVYMRIGRLWGTIGKRKTQRAAYQKIKYYPSPTDSCKVSQYIYSCPYAIMVYACRFGCDPVLWSVPSADTVL